MQHRHEHDGELDVLDELNGAGGGGRCATGGGGGGGTGKPMPNRLPETVCTEAC